MKFWWELKGKQYKQHVNNATVEVKRIVAVHAAWRATSHNYKEKARIISLQLFLSCFKYFFPKKILFDFQVVVLGRQKHRTLRHRLHSPEARLCARPDDHPKMDAKRIHGPSGQSPSCVYDAHGDNGARRLQWFIKKKLISVELSCVCINPSNKK